MLNSTYLRKNKEWSDEASCLIVLNSHWCTQELAHTATCHQVQPWKQEQMHIHWRLKQVTFSIAKNNEAENSSRGQDLNMIGFYDNTQQLHGTTVSDTSQASPLTP